MASASLKDHVFGYPVYRTMSSKPGGFKRKTTPYNQFKVWEEV
jgi:hypothetical protein